jgi:hypothetical protein
VVCQARAEETSLPFVYMLSDDCWCSRHAPRCLWFTWWLGDVAGARRCTVVPEILSGAGVCLLDRALVLCCASP